MSDRRRIIPPSCEPGGLTRRSFLRSVCTAVGMTSLASTVFDLRRIAAAAALPGDYKALVCVFQYGGNDSNNLLVPRGADYAAYAERTPPLLPRRPFGSPPR